MTDEEITIEEKSTRGGLLWSITWKGWFIGCWVCYGLGVLNEKLWPGERMVPQDLGEVCLVAVVILVALAPFALGRMQR